MLCMPCMFCASNTQCFVQNTGADDDFARACHGCHGCHERRAGLSWQTWAPATISRGRATRQRRRASNDGGRPSDREAACSPVGRPCSSCSSCSPRPTRRGEVRSMGGCDKIGALGRLDRRPRRAPFVARITAVCPSKASVRWGDGRPPVPVARVVSNRRGMSRFARRTGLLGSKMLWAGCGISPRAYVQTCVKNPVCILGIWSVKPGEV
jgi:hypothetical protein